MNTLTHFLDTPKRSEISALLKPLPISSTICDSRGLNNIGRSSLTAFRLLPFVVIDASRHTDRLIYHPATNNASRRGTVVLILPREVVPCHRRPAPLAASA